MSEKAAPAEAGPSAAAEFLRGAWDIVPIIVATVPFGIIYGALAAREGLSLGEGVLMSGVVYAGASQFVALELWADPLPFLTIFLSVVAVNLRHILYSAALGRKTEHWPAPARYLGFAFLTDPTFALAESKGGDRLGLAYYFGLSLPLYLGFLAMSAVGLIFGNLVRNPEMLGFDFIIPAYFLFLVVGFRKRPNAVPVILASAAGSLALYLAAGSPWHYAGGAGAGIAVAVLLASPARSAV